MGVVYEVRHPNAPQSFALKLMHCGGAASSVDLERFRREADMVLRIRHPNLVAVYERGDSPHGLYLVSDLVEGEDLKTKLRTGVLPPLQSAQIVRDLTSAVQALHDNHVLHRDLKPENVILRPDGTPVLLDFGVARDLKAESLTHTGQLLGTPAFMSPEQVEGDKSQLGPHTDVYGLGAILFTLLCGRYPHAGGSLPATLKMILVDEPAWPRTDHPSVPLALEAICKRAMAKETHERYPTAQALGADLQRFLDGTKTQGGTDSTQSAGRSRVVAGVALLLAVLGIAALGGIAIGRRSTTTPQAAPTPVEPAPVEPAPVEPAPIEAPNDSNHRYTWKRIASNVQGQGPGTTDQWQAMAYVPEREGMLLYGGLKPNRTPDDYRDLTSLWLWKGKDWERLESTDIGSELGVRTAGGLVYDTERSVLVRYGGLKHIGGPKPLIRQDLWEGRPDGSTKTFRDYTTPDHPIARCFHGMVWDSSRKATVIVGGLKKSLGTPQEPTNEIYYRTGDGWQTREVFGPKPIPRSRHALGYDPERKTLVLFAGHSEEEGNQRDLWELKAGAERWRQVQFTFEGEQAPGNADGFVNGASFVFDTKLKELILHGGGVGGKPLYRTYLYNGARFKEIARDGPKADYAAFAWDPKRKVAVLHGRGVGTWELSSTPAEAK